jgi:acyl-CoA dehydrogenase
MNTDDTDEVLAAAEQIAAPARERPAGELDRDVWTDLEEAGFTLVSVPERLGGSGGTLPQAAAVLRAAGRTGLAAPLAETMWLAGWLLAASEAPVPPGPLTAALAGDELVGAPGGWLLDGVLPRVPWAASADQIVVLARDHDGPVVVRLSPGEVELRPGRNLAGEARDDVVCRRIHLDDDRVTRAGPGVTTRGFLDRAALARVVALAGAAEEVLRLTVRHAGEREQFGRPLAKFQAVQQLLAQLAGETTSMVVAAQAATLALDEGSAEEAGFAAAAAKSSAARSAGRIAAYGHQVLGAMGFTVEHPLHRSTTRMWAWREEFGNERQHALELGRRLLAGNPWDQIIGNR